jgi:hypothetical protein
MNRNFCKQVLLAGGEIIPLLIPADKTGGTGLMNPSIFIRGNEVLCNVRHVNYTLWHSENEQLFNNRFGPLAYLHPENDIKLRTLHNFLCVLNDDYTVNTAYPVDTKLLDKTPSKFDFIGHEDARLFQWEKKLYLSGCRRDVKDNGESRMDLSNIVFRDGNVEEISRFRIPTPIDKESYCEKNWMPILDMPFHYIKWTNPTEVVKVNPKTRKTEQVFLAKGRVEELGDLRGGSQVLRLGDYRICMVHQVNLIKTGLGQKDAKYSHRFVVWDLDWNFAKVTDPFQISDAEIEFVCGMAVRRSHLLISFGFQDNAAFILKVPMNFIEDFLGLEFYLPALKTTHGLAPIHVINYEGHIDRKAAMVKEFESYGITDYKIVTSTKKEDHKNIIKGPLIKSVSPISLSVCASHIRAIAKWYVTGNEPYLIIMEDDLLLETLQYWSFTWEDFMESLPPGWDCIQLGCISEKQTMKLHKRQPEEWSVMAYMITRNYAARLTLKYFRVII